jgi:DNA-binding GntR family transcriptional regulator
MEGFQSVYRPTSLRQQVYDQLRAALRAGKYQPAQRITEIGVAKALGVSRTPVREALGLLSREGLLVPLPHGGYQVPVVDESDIAEIFEIRRLLEPYAASEAARRANHKGVTEMHQAVQREKTLLTESDPAVFADCDRAFRASLFGMSGNRRLARTIAQYEDHVQYVRRQTLEDWQSRSLVMEGQERIMAAVRNRDSATAASAMKAHLDSSRDALMQVLSRARTGAPPQSPGRRAAAE